MKIICNKEDFATLVRSCVSSYHFENCCGCVLYAFCSRYQELDELDIMRSIEEICEISEKE